MGIGWMVLGACMWKYLGWHWIGGACVVVGASVMERGYFPGLYTALGFWILGPVLLRKLVGGMVPALIVSFVFALVLIPALTFGRVHL